MNIDTGMYKEICCIYRSLFNFTKAKKVKFSKETNIYVTTINQEQYELHEKLFGSRKRQNNEPPPPMTNLFKEPKKTKKATKVPKHDPKDDGDDDNNDDTPRNIKKLF